MLHRSQDEEMDRLSLIVTIDVDAPLVPPACSVAGKKRGMEDPKCAHWADAGYCGSGAPASDGELARIDAAADAQYMACECEQACAAHAANEAKSEL